MKKPKYVTWVNNESCNFASMNSDEYCMIGSDTEIGVAEIYTVKDAKKLIKFLERFIVYLGKKK